jgi:MerR family transcriptional regulator, light-induced transcriptional regulator
MDSYSSESQPENAQSEHCAPPWAGIDPEAAQRNHLLAKAVEYEILPRLMLAHRFTPSTPMAAPSEFQAISPTEVFDFCRLVMHADDASLCDAVDALRLRGVPQQAILLDLLAPTARHLGELWERDLCDFNEVTVALGRLQQLLRDGSACSLPSSTQHSPQGRSILLTPCPGEQHTFGLSVVAEFFHQAQWDVSAGHMSDASPSTLVKQQWFDVVGLSMGSAASLNTLIQCIKDIRRVSINTQVLIILGGPIFTLHPEFAAQMAADAVITDGSQAPALAEQLMSRMATKV